MVNLNLLLAIDTDYLLFLQNLREITPEWITDILFYFSDFTAGVIALIVIAAFYWSVDKKQGAFMLMSYSSAIFANNMIKAEFCIYRPWIRDSRLHIAQVAASSATGYSFPSGHSTLAANFFTSLALWPQKASKRLTAFCAAALIIASFARNWVGAHTPQDVIIGAALGIFTVLLCRELFMFVSRREKFDLVVTGSAIIISVLAFIWLSFKSWPMDYNSDGTLVVDPVIMAKDAYKAAGVLAGFFAGWLVECRFIKFSTDIPVTKRILRSAVAVPSIGIAYVLLSAAGKATGPRWGSFVIQAVLMFMATGGIPFLFKFKIFN